MRTTSILLIACLAIAVSTTGLFIDFQKARVEREQDWDVVRIPCVGGSQDYKWEFDNVPQGWYVREDKVYVPKGKFDQSKYYGLKVKVFDNLFKSFLQQSVFFNIFDNQVHDCFGFDFDLDFEDTEQIKKVVEKRKIEKPQRPVKKTEKQITVQVYTFPSQEEIQQNLSAGDIEWIRKIIISVINSRSLTCSEASDFLNKLLATIQAHITVLTESSVQINKDIILLREQIKFLQEQIKELNGKYVDVQTLKARLAEYRINAQELTAERTKLNERIQNGLENVQSYEKQILSLRTEIIAPSQFNYDQSAAEITRVDDEIKQLQARLAELRAERADHVDRLNIADAAIQEARTRISTLNSLINKVRSDNTELESEIQGITLQLTSIEAKIADLVAQIENQQSTGASIKELNAKIDAKTAQIKERSVQLSSIDVLIIDLKNAYTAFEKRVNKHYYSCYTDGNGNDNNNDNGDNSSGKDNHDSGNGNNRDSSIGTDAFTNYLKSLFGAVYSPNIRTRFSGVGQVGVKSLTIFSPAWVKVYGLPYSGGYGNSMDIMNTEFSCATTEESQDLDVFKGYISRITRNFIDVKDSHGDQYTVHLGGCTRIETITENDIPQVGDSVYWKGSRRPRGSSRQYNGHHVTCY